MIRLCAGVLMPVAATSLLTLGCGWSPIGSRTDEVELPEVEPFEVEELCFAAVDPDTFTMVDSCAEERPTFSR